MSDKDDLVNRLWESDGAFTNAAARRIEHLQAENERLQSIARMADHLLSSLYEFPDDTSCSAEWVDSLNRSLEQWKNEKETP